MTLEQKANRRELIKNRLEQQVRLESQFASGKDVGELIHGCSDAGGRDYICALAGQRVASIMLDIPHWGARYLQARALLAGRAQVARQKSYNDAKEYRFSDQRGEGRRQHWHILTPLAARETGDGEAIVTRHAEQAHCCEGSGYTLASKLFDAPDTGEAGGEHDADKIERATE